MENRPIVQTLRNMQINDVEKFPLRQLASIRNSIYLYLIEEVAEGRKWSLKKNTKEQCLDVKRVS
ncbi:MAG: hypothetical protein IJF46_08430 [Bacteroidaceae bacterium]|nr:hypothetical protein [Bacteroidaceae bacterium]